MSWPGFEPGMSGLASEFEFEFEFIGITPNATEYSA